ncbi:MAG TPA: PHB depolymerase family esterase [Kofleriaceae bacterium]
MRRVVLALIVCSAVRADATQNQPPCAGCTLEISASTDPVPLVVVLHGDTDNARERATKWRAAVAKRGWALLSLECPERLGCPDGSWYRWRHDPGWVREQVREVTARHRIDASRIYLVGWSGGATFIGKHLDEWPRMFAATVIHGGGVPPRAADCPDRAFPAYFLVGDKNPAHGAAKRLRAFLEDCKQSVRWDLLLGANHAQEDDALTWAKADQILGWLANRRRNEAVAGR